MSTYVCSVNRKDPEEKLLDHEIIKVRQAIVALRQRKDLTAAEQELFRSMQARLRQLNEQKRSRASSVSGSPADEHSHEHEAESSAEPKSADSDAHLIHEGEHKKKKDKAAH